MGTRLSYNHVMTAKLKKLKRQKTRSRPGKVGRLQAAAESELLLLAEEAVKPEARWNRPRKRHVSLRVDVEVLEWFQAMGPGYQTRMNRILRRVMEDEKKAER